MSNDATVKMLHTVENLAIVWRINCVSIDSLLNLAIIPQRLCLFVVVVFNCDKNTLHEIYPFNRFLSVQHSTVNCKHSVTQHIPKTYLSYVTETL